MGSQLISADGKNTLLWPSLQGAVLGGLALKNPVYVQDILRKYDLTVKKGVIYQPLIDALTGAGFVEYNYQNNAYVADGRPERITSAKCDVTQTKATLFIFPYDWRQLNEKTAGYLKDYVDCIRQIYKGVTVDIVAHSMGGLVARRMILDTNTQAAGNHPYVRSLITLGTPFWGAPQASYKIERGDLFGLPRLNALFGWANPLNAGVLGTIQPFTSLHELLPSKTLFANSPAAQSPFGEGGVGLLGFGDIRYWDINGSKAEEKNYNYANAGDVPPGYKALMDVIRFPVFTPMTTNETFHIYANANKNQQDDWSADTTGVSNFHIIGIGEHTAVKLGAFHLLGIKNIPVVGGWLKRLKPGDYLAQIFGNGDGTVPRLSAERTKATNDPNATLRVLLGSTGKGLEHVALVQDADPLNCVLQFLGLGNKCPNSQALYQAALLPASLRIELHNVQSVAALDATGNQIDALDGSPALPFYSTSDAALTIPPGQEVFIQFQTLTDPDASSLLQVTTTDDNGNDIRKTVYLDPQTRFDRPPEQVNGMLGQLHIDPLGNTTLQFDFDGDGGINSLDDVVAPTVDTTDPNMVADDAGPAIVVSNIRTGSDGLRYVMLQASDPSGLLADTGIGTPPFVVSLQNDGTVIDNLVTYSMGTEVAVTPGADLTACAVDGAANRSCVVFNIP